MFAHTETPVGHQDPLVRRRRPRLGRTRTGCLTCRRRRKKCDECRPTCVACTRNGLTCIWPRRPLLVNRTDSPGTPRLEQEKSPSTLQLDVETSPRPFQPEQASSSGASIDPLTDGVVEDSTDHGPDSEGAFHAGDAVYAISPHRIGFQLTSPLRLHLGDSHATLRMPLSPLLLRNYIENTSNLLVVKPPSANPFIYQVLPLAYFDEVLMNAVLAMGGEHLIGRQGTDFDIQRTTWHHYAFVLQHVRTAANELATLSAENILRLLLVLLILCNVEAFSGDRRGSMFTHLRAARQLILHFLELHAGTDNEEMRSRLGFALEMYCFLTLVANVTPYGTLEDRTLPFDSFLLSLAYLEGYDTFGVFFSCGYDLFEMIPLIALFSRKRLREEQEGNGSCSLESYSTYQKLLSALEDWRSSPPNREMEPWQAEHEAAGEVYRHALFIYLKASMCGSTVDNPKVICEIQEHVDIILRSCNCLYSTPYCTILLWPALIAGSCLIQQDQRRSLVHSLRSNTCSMVHMLRASELLELLWKDNDKRSFGPYGLFLMMKKHDLNVCVV